MLRHLVLIVLLCPAFLCAQSTLYWAGNAHDPAVGGDGIWDASTMNWSTVRDGYASSVWPNLPGASSHAVLGGSSAGVLDVNIPYLYGNSLSVERNYTLNTNGRAVNFNKVASANSEAILTVTGGGTFTADLTAGVIVLNGNGTKLRTGGPDPLGGRVVLNEGTILETRYQGSNSQIAIEFNGSGKFAFGGGALRVGPISSTTMGAGVIEGSSIYIKTDQASGESNYSGLIQNSVSGPMVYQTQVWKEGDGTLLLGGSQKTYTGGTVIAQGILRLGAANVLPAVGAVRIGSNYPGTLDLNGFDQTIETLSGPHGESAILLGAGTLTFGGHVQYAPDGTYAGTISGAGKIVKTGSKGSALTGANLHSGGTIVEGGMLLVGHPLALGSGPVEFRNGTTLVSNVSTLAKAISFPSGEVSIRTDAYTQSTYSGILSGDAKLNFYSLPNQYAPPMEYSLTGANTYAGGTKIKDVTIVAGADAAFGNSNGAMELDGGAIRWAQAFDFSAGRSFTLSGTNKFLPNGFTTTLAQGLAGTGGLEINGSGVVRLLGASSFSGGLVIGDYGTLEVGGDAALGAAGGSVLFKASSTLRFLASTLVDPTRTLTFTSPSGSIAVAPGAVVGLPVAIASSWTGSAYLNKWDAGKLVYETRQTYKATTWVRAGTLMLGAGDNTLPSDNFVLVEDAGVLDLGGSNQTLRGVGGTGVVELGGATLTMTDPHVVYSGAFSGSGSVRKKGNGVFELYQDYYAEDRSQNFEGSLYLEAGVLELINGRLGDRSTLVLANGTALAGWSSVGKVQAEGDVTVSPGYYTTGPGTGVLDTRDITLGAGSRYLFHVMGAGSPIAISADLLRVTGRVTLHVSAGAPFAVSVASLGPSGVPGNLLGFNQARNYAFTLVSTTEGIAGLAPETMTLNLVDFKNSYTGTFRLALANEGRDLTLRYVAKGLANWVADRFSASELADPAISGLSADPDGDGLPNIVEYALGLEPNAGSAMGLPAATMTNTDWVYTYTKPVSVADVAYAVEVSTDLVTWSTADVIHEKVSATTNTEVWRARYPVAMADNVFFRLKVTQL